MVGSWRRKCMAWQCDAVNQSLVVPHAYHPVMVGCLRHYRSNFVRLHETKRTIFHHPFEPILFSWWIHPSEEGDEHIAPTPQLRAMLPASRFIRFAVSSQNSRKRFWAGAYNSEEGNVSSLCFLAVSTCSNVLYHLPSLWHVVQWNVESTIVMLRNCNSHALVLNKLTFARYPSTNLWWFWPSL